MMTHTICARIDRKKQEDCLGTIDQHKEAVSDARTYLCSNKRIELIKWIKLVV